MDYEETKYNESLLPEGISLKDLPSYDNFDFLDTECLDRIGKQVVEGYDQDEESRLPWIKKYNNALKLALQVVEEKNSPWEGASNVKFPSMTLAAMTFHARAYPSLVPGKDLVQVKHIGNDYLGFKRRRAERIKVHLNYQFLDQMEEWEEDMDRLLITLPITGTEFKKAFYSSALGRNVSKHIHAKDLVVDYFAKSLDKAERVTEILSLSLNEIREMQNEGIYYDCDLEESAPRDDESSRTQDKTQGRTSPDEKSQQGNRMVLEQHCWYDLDCDGYAEPYIVTVDYHTCKVLRMVARFAAKDVQQRGSKVIKVTPTKYYVKYSFIPSPDGGFYDVGFGTLISPLNETINTLINQLIDAGTLSNLQSGFISKSFRVKSGSHKFKAGEWKVVNATGMDIKNGILPLPVREPSMVLFQLLGLMIEVTQKVTSTTDIMVGESPGQNQKATTTQAVMDSGLKVFTAIYKRLRRALTKEILMVYSLNRDYLDEKEYFNVVDPEQKEMLEYKVLKKDYEDESIDIKPTADPNATSPLQKMERAAFILAGMKEGLPIAPIPATLRYLKAGEIENPEELLIPAEELAKPPMDAMLKDRQLSIKEEDSKEKNALKARKQQLDEFKTLAKVRQDDEKLDLDIEDKRGKRVLQAVDIQERSRTERVKANAKPRGNSE